MKVVILEKEIINQIIKLISSGSNYSSPHGGITDFLQRLDSVEAIDIENIQIKGDDEKVFTDDKKFID